MEARLCKCFSRITPPESRVSCSLGTESRRDDGLVPYMERSYSIEYSPLPLEVTDRVWQLRFSELRTQPGRVDVRHKTRFNPDHKEFEKKPQSSLAGLGS